MMIKEITAMTVIDVYMANTEHVLALLGFFIPREAATFAFPPAPKTVAITVIVITKGSVTVIAEIWNVSPVLPTKKASVKFRISVASWLITAGRINFDNAFGTLRLSKAFVLLFNVISSLLFCTLLIKYTSSYKISLQANYKGIKNEIQFISFFYSSKALRSFS